MKPILLNYHRNGFALYNPDVALKTFDTKTVFLIDTINTKELATENLKVSNEDSLHISKLNSSDLLMQNYGNNFNYDLKLKIFSGSGTAPFSHYSVPIDQNSAHYIVPNWNDLENDPVKILIDLGNDGSIDDSLFLNNQILNVENHNSPFVPKFIIISKLS